MPFRPVSWPVRPFGSRARTLLALASGGALLLLPSCDSAPTTAPRICAAGQWAVESEGIRPWQHDCEPYVSSHFTVYSDASSQDARATLASVAEDVLAELAHEFEIKSYAELGLTDGYRYYVYAQGDSLPGVAAGYRNGFLMPAVDRGPPPGIYHRHPTWYRRTVKHELMHVFQFTLTDCPKNSDCPYWLDVWFREGQAVFASQTHPIPTLQGYRAWVADPTHVNPLAIRRRQDFPDLERMGEYYSMFGLAVAYLMDGTRGHGATIGDCRDLFQYMKEGDPFELAFERASGVSVSYLRDNFFEIMEADLGG